MMFHHSSTGNAWAYLVRPNTRWLKRAADVRRVIGTLMTDDAPGWIMISVVGLGGEGEPLLI